MVTVQGAWSDEQMASFLEEALVPVRLGCHHPHGGLWMVSLWYRYADGCLLCATGRSSDIAAFLRRDSAVSFEISTNRPPYMGVRGSGTATLETDESKELLTGLLERYLGGTDSELGAFLLDDDREELVIRIEPERLFTWDFADRMADVVADSPASRAAEPASPRHGPASEP
jgi:nitroimidazol reductase NimA-like FMN-containing flavoprotein (pyridoxamine 5'-phosphate oxidase superfamily)